jgi:hypothetical protein
MKKLFKITNLNYHLLILGLAWIIVQAVQFKEYGIVTGLEAIKYINEANHFLQFGTLSTNNFWLYSTQIFLIAGAIKLHLSFVIIVILQYSLNLFATWMFYQLAIYLLKKPILAFLVTLIFIINLTYQVFNSYLFTESMFYSLTIIFSSYLLRIKKLTLKNGALLLALVMLLSVTRPTGILFFGAACIYLFFRFMQQIGLWNKIAILCAAAFIFLFTLNTMLQTGGELDFMLPFKQENIICGVNTNHNTQVETLEKGNSLKGLAYYVMHNKDQFLRLAKLKTVAFFGYTRDYYSKIHNAYLMIFFYPFYLLSIIGFVKLYKRKEKILIYLLIIIGLYWITTLLTCDDWHNRFILTVSPFIFLIGMAAFIKPSSVIEKPKVPS